MNIHATITVFCLLAVAGISFASGPTTKIADEALKSEKQDLTPDQQMAAAIITLVRKCEEQVDAASKAGNENKVGVISSAAWAVAVTFMRQTHDSAAKSWLLREWNAAWKNPSYVPMLSSGMARAGADRSFVSKDVLDAWKAAEDDSTLESMAYWVATYGTDDDVKFLDAKIRSLKDPKKVTR